MADVSRIAARLYGTPLLMNPASLDGILSVVAPRLAGGTFDAAAFQVDDSGSDNGMDAPDGVAVISVSGSLVRRTYGLDALCGMVSYESIRAEIDAAVADTNVRAIVLDVDSPGGEAAGVFDLADAIFEARKSKPVWAVANEEAYSAAYAIASAADVIYVPRTGGVGSVGVVAAHVDQSAADKKAGVAWTFIHAGARKVDGNSHEPLSDRASASLQGEVDRLYGMFVDTVARNRGMSSDTIRATEAGLYFGADAVKAGLADRVGTMRDALAALGAQLKRSNSTTMSTKKGKLLMSTETDAAKAEDELEVVVEQTPADEPETTDTEAAVSENETETESGSETEIETPAVENEPVAAASKRAKPTGPALSQEDVSTIIELCELAGRPQAATEFLKRGASAADVRKALLKAKADESDSIELSTAAPTSTSEKRPEPRIDAAAIYSKLNQR